MKQKVPGRRDSSLLELFHSQQSENPLNYISRDSILEIARRSGRSPAEIRGVLSFYHLFSSEPRGLYIIRVCDSLSCRISRSLGILHFLEDELGINCGKTTPDGLFTLERVHCLGSCDTAPNMMINEQLFTHLDCGKLVPILEQFRKEAEDAN